MDRQLPRVLGQWLKLLGADISVSFLADKLYSHPDYPSILSITETLNSMHISNSAILVEKDRLHDIPVPFLAHMNNKKKKLSLVTNTTSHLKEHPSFNTLWDGVVLVAESPASDLKFDNETWKQKEKKKQFRFAAFATLFLVLIGLTIYIQPGMLMTCLLFVMGLGVLVSTEIVRKDMGNSSAVGDKLCSADNENNCDDVIRTGKQKLPAWLPVTDLVFIWFLSLLLSITFGILSGLYLQMITIIVVLSLAACVPAIASVIYQWKVIKKWCTLCLITGGIIGVQAIIAMGLNYNRGFVNPGFTAITLTILLFAITAISWLGGIKPLLVERGELESEKYRLRQFRNSPKIIRTLLDAQPMGISMEAWSHDIQLANPQAKTQLIVACNPYCRPCAQAHSFLHNYIESADVGLSIRFLVTNPKEEDRKMEAIRYILNVTAGKDPSFNSNVITHWYNSMNLEEFKKLYPLNNIESMQFRIDELANWTINNKVSYTPALFVDGRELPRQYNIYDLDVVLATSS